MTWNYTKEAVERATKILEATWIKNGMAIAKTGNYARSIHSFFVVDNDIDFIGVVYNDAPYAAALEYGLSPFDMKPYLLNSKYARTSAKGNRYLRIPFRHGIPGSITLPAMPQKVYQRAKQLTGNKRLGMINYGIRTKLNTGFKDEQGRGVGPYTWKTGPYYGMKKYGRKGHTQYMTFRTVSSVSPSGSWWHPGIKEKRIAQKSSEEVAQEIEHLITNAINKDIENILKGGAVE